MSVPLEKNSAFLSNRVENLKNDFKSKKISKICIIFFFCIHAKARSLEEGVIYSMRTKKIRKVQFFCKVTLYFLPNFNNNIVTKISLTVDPRPRQKLNK